MKTLAELTEEEIMSKLQSIKENEFTQEILVPLFFALQYERVEFFGGPGEEGKDLVCWKRGEIGDVELTVAQVKRFRPTSQARDTKSFSEIVTQLSQAVEKPLPYLDGVEYLPEKVYLITPFRVDTAALQTRFEAFQALRPRRVSILDGPRLVEQLRKRAPDVLSRFLGIRAKLQATIVPQLTNEILLRALESPENKSIHRFFTDIDFIMGGRPSTRLFFSVNIRGRKEQFFGTENDLSMLISIDKTLRCLFRVGILVDSIPEMEQKFQRLEQKHAAWKVGHTSLLSYYYRRHQELQAIEGHYKSLQLSIDSFNSRELGEGLGLEAARKEYEKSLAEYEELRSEVERSQKIEPRLTGSIRLDGEKIAEALSKRRSDVERAIERYQGHKGDSVPLVEFLAECSELFAVVSSLFSHEATAKAIGMAGDLKERPDAINTRLSFPVQDLLDTNINITVMGDAGAGKTTTLQMYAYRLLTSQRSEELVLFAPLSRLFNEWRSLNLGDAFLGKIPALEEILSHYLNNIGCKVSPATLLEHMQAKGGVLLLDGIDEVFYEAPWILTSITRFSERLPLVHFVASSRTTGSYLESLPFLGITLLPFTKKQRGQFIENWFEGDEKKVGTVLSHLEQVPDLDETTRNPLLATVLCVLARHDIQLPTSEVKLYDERLRLLLGQYDLHKGIKRIKTHSTNLYILAKAIAFRLHAEGKRDESKEVLYTWSIEVLGENLPLGDVLSVDECRQAIDELFDPCNVLVTSPNGGLGFGHLRFQEHLAAHEIAGNRAIAIIPLMRDEWWRSVFVLYAQMRPDFAGIVRRLADTGALASASATLEVMIRHVSERHRQRLLRELKDARRISSYDL